MSDFIRECNRLIEKQSAKELAILNQYIFNKGKNYEINHQRIFRK